MAKTTNTAISQHAFRMFLNQLGRVDKRDSHLSLTVMQAGICNGDPLGARSYVGRGMGVL
jgi:hypothetical protein